MRHINEFRSSNPPSHNSALDADDIHMGSPACFSSFSTIARPTSEAGTESEVERGHDGIPPLVPVLMGWKDHSPASRPATKQMPATVTIARNAVGARRQRTSR